MDQILKQQPNNCWSQENRVMGWEFNGRRTHVDSMKLEISSQQQNVAWKRLPDTTAHDSCVTGASHLLVMAALCPFQTDTGCTLEKHWLQQHCQSRDVTCPFAFKHVKTASVHQMMLFGLEAMRMGRWMPVLIQGNICLKNPSLWCSLCFWAAYNTPDTQSWGAKLKFWCT